MKAITRCLVLPVISISLTCGIGIVAGAADLAYPPRLTDNQQVLTSTTQEFLVPPSDFNKQIDIAKSAPTIDFLYYPVQTYPGRPWSVWGDGCAVNGKYYSAIGDHLAPSGNAYLLEYDPEKKTLRTLVDVQKLLKLPEGHYCPGKIHSRIDMGSDGWLYFSTHRGSTRVTTDQYHYQGDWIIRANPSTGASEIAAHHPVPKHCIPTSVLDPKRLIYYGGTASGDYQDKTVYFFAYDIRAKKVLHAVENGPPRYLILANSTGRVYYTSRDDGPIMRYDPESGKPPEPIGGRIGLRSATQETSDGFVYTVANRNDAMLYRFNTRTEQVEELGSAIVGSQSYITSLDVDPTGRYLYYVPGAHGGSEKDGTPIVQFDLKTRKKKVLAFLFPYYQKQIGYVPIGTFGSAVDPQGDKLYITWNGSRAEPRRGRYDFDTCALTVIHIPESERQ